MTPSPFKWWYIEGRRGTSGDRPVGTTAGRSHHSRMTRMRNVTLGDEKYGNLRKKQVLKPPPSSSLRLRLMDVGFFFERSGFPKRFAFFLCCHDMGSTLLEGGWILKFYFFHLQGVEWSPRALWKASSFIRRNWREWLRSSFTSTNPLGKQPPAKLTPSVNLILSVFEGQKGKSSSLYCLFILSSNSGYFVLFLVVDIFLCQFHFLHVFIPVFLI